MAEVASVASPAAFACSRLESALGAVQPVQVALCSQGHKALRPMTEMRLEFHTVDLTLATG